jgi:zinc protease
MPIAPFLVFLAVLFPARVLHANPYEFRLDNGLRLVVKEDRRAPTVVQQVWYRAGSMDEENGVTGVAHVLEHMMFKGTKRYPPGEFSRLIAEAGGRENAFTSTDFTVYHEQVHKDRLPLIMELEADRMANLVLTEKEFKPEIQVVMEERRLRTEDQPRALVYEAWMASAFNAHPYRWPVVGWMGDLQNMTWKDAYAWYRDWYGPNNATVVIVGDVDAQQVLKWARQYYGPLAMKSLRERKISPEPPQRGPRRVMVKAPAELPYLRMGYKAPALRDARKDWEPYALSLLGWILAGNEAARLNQSLVRERRIATTADADYDMIQRGPGIFAIDAAVAGGKKVEELEAALKEMVAQLIRDGVSAEELARAKTQRIAQEVYKRDSLFAQAMEIGSLESTGLSYRDVDLIVERLRGVTAEQVRNVAAKYLVDDNLTVAVLQPTPPGAPDRAGLSLGKQ